MEKTYKRETAWVFAIFVAALFMWGLISQRGDIIDVAKYLLPFSMGGLTAALGADFTRKQMKP